MYNSFALSTALRYAEPMGFLLDLLIGIVMFPITLMFELIGGPKK